MLLADNVCRVASDGVQARIGPPGEGKEWLESWLQTDAPGAAAA